MLKLFNGRHLITFDASSFRSFSCCYYLFTIDLLNNKSHGLSPPGGFSSLTFDQVVPYYSQRHLADWNAIYIDKTVPGFLDVIPFQSLDVAIFVV